MKVEILASVMNQKNKDEIVKRLGVSDLQKCLIINQVTNKNLKPKDDHDSNHRFISFNEKGLSRSRNRALEMATGDIILFSDNDCQYVEDYENIVKSAYKKYPDADVIAFSFIYDYNKKPKKLKKEGRVGFLKSMSISSVQISCKRKSLKEKGIQFDEQFGTGSNRYQWGEENIFLFDCLRTGLKIYYIPIIIIIKDDQGTTWSKSNTTKHFNQQGAVYYRMSPRFYWLLGLQFAIRKRHIFKKDMTSWQVFHSIMCGAKEYRKEKKNG